MSANAVASRRHVGFLNSDSMTTAATLVSARALKPGATIGLFSPSEPVGGGRLTRMNKNLAKLEAAGFRVVEAAHVHDATAYTAGSVEARIEDIHELASRPDVDCLLSTWGGKQCNELVERLDYDLIGSTRKPVISFSDGCVILNAITARTGLATFHGPNVAGKLDESAHSDLEMLRAGHAMSASANVFGDSASEVWTPWRAGSAEGRLYGGNLSTFALGLAGTRFLNVNGPVIFFWEAMGERPQILHQYLTCLVNGGWFDRVVGMVVGDLIFDPLDEGTEWKAREARDAILHAVADFSFPVAHSPSFGHRRLENPIVPIGARCALDADAAKAPLLDTVVE